MAVGTLSNKQIFFNEDALYLTSSSYYTPIGAYRRT
jgi:hypothetical protein